MMGLLDLHGELDLQPPLKYRGFLVLKSKRLNFQIPKPTEFAHRHDGGGVNLYWKTGGVALRITVSKAEKAILFNSRIGKDNSKGWGVEERALLPAQCSDGPITIYVHDQDDRYQVMVGIKMVHTFFKRLDNAAPVTKVGYTLRDPGPPWDVTLSKRLNVSVCTLGDLANRVRKAVERREGLHPARITNHSEPPGFIASNCHPLTMISWEDGKEIRIYYLDSERILQEYAYSEGKEKNAWYHGDLCKLNIILSSDSVIAAIQIGDEVSIYYQDPYSGIIQEAYKPALTESWVKGGDLAEAVTSSKIAAVAWTNKGNQIRVYYQDPHLYLREYCYNNARWIQGGFNPGPQPRGTPIVAEVDDVGYPEIQVLWKNKDRRFMSCRCDKNLRWDHPAINHQSSNEVDPSQPT